MRLRRRHSPPPEQPAPAPPVLHYPGPFTFPAEPLATTEHSYTCTHCHAPVRSWILNHGSPQHYPTTPDAAFLAVHNRADLPTTDLFFLEQTLTLSPCGHSFRMSQGSPRATLLNPEHWIDT